jgi:hypothetical protein
MRAPGPSNPMQRHDVNNAQHPPLTLRAPLLHCHSPTPSTPTLTHPRSIVRLGACRNVHSFPFFVCRSIASRVRVVWHGCAAFCVEFHANWGHGRGGEGTIGLVGAGFRGGVSIWCARCSVRSQCADDQVHRRGDSEPCCRGRGLQDRP